MKLSSGLERQWEWWAWPDSQMEGLRESRDSCTGDIYPGLREPETFPLRRLLDCFYLVCNWANSRQVLDFLLVLKYVEILVI